MIPFVKLNFLNKENLRTENYFCPFDGQIDSQRHYESCEAYSNLRRGKDLNEIKDIIEYFKGIIKFRHQTDERNKNVDIFETSDLESD